jgi:DNA-binding transcriptional LysR family regulator
LKQFSSESHVLVEPGGSRYSRTTSQSSTTSLIERHLAEHGLSRRIALHVPHFVVVPIIVQSTELLATVPSYVLSGIKAPHNLKSVPLPFKTPTFDVKQFWHERSHHDEANIWLRQTVASLFMHDAGV